MIQTSASTHLASLQAQHQEDEYEEEWIPPENFTLVSKGIYRSAFPKRKNFGFLKRLGLKSVLYLNH